MSRQVTVDDQLLDRLKSAMQTKLAQREQLQGTMAQLNVEIEQQMGAINLLEMALSGNIPPAQDEAELERMNGAEVKRQQRAEKRKATA